MSKEEYDREKIVRQLKDAFKDDLNITEACIDVGICRDTFYRICKEIPGLSDIFEALRGHVKMKAKRTVSKGVTEDARLALSYLKLKDKSFKEHVELGEETRGLLGRQTAETKDIYKKINDLKGKINGTS